ncbi:unnamed protein product, partial [Choristocarpus tenellus]
MQNNEHLVGRVRIPSRVGGGGVERGWIISLMIASHPKSSPPQNCYNPNYLSPFIFMFLPLKSLTMPNLPLVMPIRKEWGDVRFDMFQYLKWHSHTHTPPHTVHSLRTLNLLGVVLTTKSYRSAIGEVVNYPIIIL